MTRPHDCQWRTGDIVSLKPARCFSQDDYGRLLAPGPRSTRGYLPAQVCGHPVIILLRLSEKSTHALITPISAHGSGTLKRHDTFALGLPWARPSTKHRNKEHYRAFDGTPRPSTHRDALYLETQDMSLPMPDKSWVYIQSVWVVPLSVLRRFASGRRLRVHRDSLIDLRAHMSEACGLWKEHTARLRRFEPSAVPAPAPAPATAARRPDAPAMRPISWAAVVTASADTKTGEEDGSDNPGSDANDDKNGSGPWDNGWDDGWSDGWGAGAAELLETASSSWSATDGSDSTPGDGNRVAGMDAYVNEVEDDIHIITEEDTVDVHVDEAHRLWASVLANPAPAPEKCTRRWITFRKRPISGSHGVGIGG
ncbi:hypothetical protein B0H67DRAFT_567514 [Lasiosphaeris hirsuta]|uniref:Uncharacterized protein n=1 Tax=Lasiosphaeris hirsuta TaxID=260670 RepID=A0AA40AYF3_9PEZI|nr:hypothetical protein B0H67DRAFT_567514 [Lasiosphaeris hirsuta]